MRDETLSKTPAQSDNSKQMNKKSIVSTPTQSFDENSSTKIDNKARADDPINRTLTTTNENDFNKKTVAELSGKPTHKALSNDNLVGISPIVTTEQFKSESKLNSNDLELDMKLIREQIASSRNQPNLNSTSLNDNTLNTASNKLSQKQKGSIDSTSSTASSPTQPPKGHIKPTEELGSIQFTVEYIQALMQLKIQLISASNLPSKDSNGFSDPYVKLHLLPGIAKATKLRSKTIYKNLNPVFNEYFHYDGVTLEDIDNKILR